MIGEVDVDRSVMDKLAVCFMDSTNCRIAMLGYIRLRSTGREGRIFCEFAGDG
jgi:hypothetical protein